MYINNLQTNTSHPIPSHPLQEDLLQISQTTSRADRGRFFFCSPSCSAGQRKSHTCFMWTRDAWNPHVPSTNLPGKTLGSHEGLQRQRERRWGTKKRKTTIGLGRVTVRGTLGLNHSRRVSRKRPRFLLLLPPRHPADLGSWCRTRGFFVFFSLLTVQDRTSRKADDGGIVKLQYLPPASLFPCGYSRGFSRVEWMSKQSNSRHARWCTYIHCFLLANCKRRLVWRLGRNIVSWLLLFVSNLETLGSWAKSYT